MNGYGKLLQENQDPLSHDYYERLDLILMCTNNIRLWVSDKTRLTFGKPLHCTHCCTEECITTGFNILIAESFWGLFCAAMKGSDPVLHTDGSALNTDNTLTYSKITYFKIHFNFVLPCIIVQVKLNTNLMQHCAGFISAESLYMFRALAPIIRSI